MAFVEFGSVHFVAVFWGRIKWLGNCVNKNLNLGGGAGRGVWGRVFVLD